MGLYPDLLPGYHPTSGNSEFHREWGEIPQAAGLDLPGMVRGGKSGQVEGALCGGLESSGAVEHRSIRVLEEFRGRARYVPHRDCGDGRCGSCRLRMPTKNLGTFTNTCGDVQLVKKAGEVTGTKADFEMIVRVADAMGFDVHKLVPFGGGTRADMGQSRGAQSGEADRHAVWLEAHGLEPKMSPFDPTAILDEIQRLVPGYDVSRVELLAGNSQHTSLGKGGTGVAHRSESIAPANDDLFSSGTLGRYSRALKSVIESHEVKPAEVAAD